MSSVYPLTERGKAVFEEVIRDKCDVMALDIAHEMSGNERLLTPCVRPTSRNYVYQDLFSLGTSELKKKYVPRLGAMYYVKVAIKKAIGFQARAFLAFWLKRCGVLRP